MGKDFWDSIPEEYQTAIIDCGKEAAEYNNDLYQKQSEEMVAALEDAGRINCKDIVQRHIRIRNS